MTKLWKPLAVAVVGLSIGLAGASGVFAKGHDQGVADGSSNDPSDLRGGIVASKDVDGVGRDPVTDAFLGVADINSDLNYGIDVVQGQIEADVRRVHPRVCNGC